MCGIAGILHFGKSTHPGATVQKMTNALMHRGPDAKGIYEDEFISIGHSRLSILDLQERANQPFAAADGRYILSFNGEIYNYQELKKELSSYSFRTESDTEVLVAGFSTWGIDCLKKIDGIFSFSIWDKESKSLWLVRDRMGVKPLYYINTGQVILFASEIRSLIASALFIPELDLNGLNYFFSFQSVSSRYPILKGIKEVPAGSCLRISSEGVQEHRYWQLGNTRVEIPVDYEHIGRDVFNLIDQAVKKRMVSDVPISAFLSGGIDSSVIVALMSLHSNEKINTFTFSFNDSVYDESRYASIIAHRFKTNHTQIALNGDQLLDTVMEGLNVMDSPTADGINTYILSSAIKEAGIKVALSGVGADELFAGYPGFRQFKSIQQFSLLFNTTKILRKGIARVLTTIDDTRFSKLNELLSAENSSIESIYPALRRLFSSAELKKVMRNFPSQQNHEFAAWQRIVNADAFEPLSKYSIAEYTEYAQHTLLKDIDQMSMSNGLEVREPYFDIQLIEYVLSIPDKYKASKYVKQLLTDAVSPLLPQEIIKRKKKGFVLPWENWMRGELMAFCEQQIIELSDRDFINKRELLTYWKQFLNQHKGVKWIELWQFVVLNYWMNKNNIVYKA